MPADAQVVVRGFDELAAGTAKLAGEIKQEAGKQFGREADTVAGTVRGALPHLTGALAGSVESKTTARGGQVSMGRGISYAKFVEYGGRGHPAGRPGNYLQPAAKDAEPLLADAGEQAAQTAIGGMSWPSPT